MSPSALVYVVDDNPDIRDSIAMLLSTVGIEVTTFASADELLSAFPGEETGRPSCLLLDVRMPGMSGMTLLERFKAEHVRLPTIMITGHGDIDMAVRAMKLGAVDFLTKPFNGQRLLDLVQETLRKAAEPAASARSTEAAGELIQVLTPREREVFDRIVSGDSNKAIAFDLGVSIRTVETHRARIMQKLGAESVVDLVRLALSVDAKP